MSHFDIQLTYGGQSPKDFMILVNPTNINQGDHTIYKDLFPAAWKVAQFPGSGDEDISRPIKVTYKQDLTVLIAEVDSDNLIKAQDFQPVTTTLKDYKAISSGSAFRVVPASTPQRSDASIDNKSGTSLQVGIGDINGNAYLTVQCDPDNLAEFVSKIEFAIVPVSNYVETQQYKGDVRGKWISFNATDVVGGHIFVTHDGQKFTPDDTGSNIFKLHNEDERVFG